MSTAQLAAWLLTYLVHSTLLLLGAWALARSGWFGSLAAREWLWRAALLGGLLSASLQVFAGVRPWSGSTRLPERVATTPERVATAMRESSARVLPMRFEKEDEPRTGVVRGERVALVKERPAVVSRTQVPASPPSEARPLGARLLVVAPALGSFFLGLWLIGLALRVRLALGRRRALREGPWARELAALARAAGMRREVRLTHSGRISAPVALGVLRPEVCVPTRALRELPVQLARPALAHELAHLVRLDPLWLGLAHVLRSLFFVQPLNRLAARELAHLAELSADEWAVCQTGDRLALARCLTEFAGWLCPIEPPLGACAMVRRRGRLEERVRRLLAEGARMRRASHHGRALLCALALFVLAPLVLPGWSSAQPTPNSPVAATPALGWRATELEISALEEQLASIETRIASLPAGFGAPLIARLHALRAQLTRLHAVAERGVARSEAQHESGGPR